MEVSVRLDGSGERAVPVPRNGVVADLQRAAASVWGTEASLIELVRAGGVLDMRSNLADLHLEEGDVVLAAPSSKAIARATLLRRGIPEGFSPTKLLIDLCTDGDDPDLPRLLLEAGADANAISFGRTVLFTATTHRKTAMCEALLEFHAHADTVDGNTGLTALQCAAQHGFADTVIALLGYANPAHCGDAGHPALHLACSRQHRDAVEALLQAVPVDMVGKKGRTALHITADLGLSDMADLLLHYEADPCAKDEKLRTALHIAAGKGHYELVRMLVERFGRVVVALRDERGQTALHHAAAYGDSRSVACLARGGCPLNVAARPGGFTALHLAAYEGNFPAVYALLQGGASVDLPAANGCTALQVAAMRGRVEIMKLLKPTGKSVKK